jgi:hypothetical protein
MKRILTLTCIAVLLAAGSIGMGSAAFAQSPSMDKRVDPLPVPPVATKTYKPLLSLFADYYEIDMRASKHKFNSSLGAADVWTYAQPGAPPCFLAQQLWRNRAGL